MKRTISLAGVVIFLLMLTQFNSCKKDEKEPDVIASFTAAVDTVNFKMVTFTNFSTNYSALLWNFGDATPTSAEVNPVHTYADYGVYTVVLVATSNDGTKTNTYTKDITLSDPDAELTKLAGDVSKTWKLIRDVSTNRYPLEVGPPAHDAIWWAFGLNEDLAVRPCMLNDEWTFQRDGVLVFDDKGDYWAEGSIYPDGSNNACFSSSDPMLNKDGVDVSAWKSGTHQFVFTTTANPPTLQVIGTGAYLGLQKVSTDAEITVPQDQVTYNVISLTDGTTDTLIVQVDLGPAGASTAYWRFVLVHYDNPADEPPMPDPKPAPGFTYAIDGYTVTFTNTSTLSDTYLWDFGDGSATSTETNPVHTYAGDGIYPVVLTAYNANGEKSTSQTITITTAVLTEEVLTAGTWRLQLSGHSIYCGPAMGSDGWWTCPLANLDGTMGGTADDWSCMMDDEFIFSTGGGYEYKTMGGSRNDGYMDAANHGCWTDAQIAASPGAPFGSCNTHTFAFTPASGSDRAKIVLTNGPNFAAFIGFMKGFYGGENLDGANPPNGGFATNQYEVITYGVLGGKEVMVVSVDLTPDHNGGSSWSMTLER
jgi:PKD repeat protein